MFNLLAALAL